MSPLNHGKGGARRRGTRRMVRAALCAACLFALVFAARVGVAAGDGPVLRGADLRRAEKVLSKLRLLFNAADADDADAYRDLASKFFPGLFVMVAEMRQSDLSTDLSTAVFLAEELGRKWSAAGAVAADCGRERPDIYLPLCLDLRGGTVRRLLLAKARLHARWAGAALRSCRGESDSETSRALSEMAAARANDVLIAARVVETLKPLEEILRHSAPGAGRGGRLGMTTAAGFDGSEAEFDDALRVAGDLLAWMPRGQSFYRLSGARQAYADGLSWHLKASRSKSLVVSVNSFAPDPLKALGLDAGQAGAAAAANWKSAPRLTRLTEQSLSGTAR